MQLRNFIAAPKTITVSIALGLLISQLVSIPSAEAARVEKVKDKQVLIDIESSDIKEGEKYFIIIDGKKKAVVVIKQVKNGKALGRITKGKAEVDATVEPTGHAKTADNGADGSDDDILKKKKKGKKSRDGSGKASSDDGTAPVIVGAMGGYAMDSQNVTFSNGQSISMSGSGYSLKAFGDIPFSGSLGLLTRGGIEQFNVASGASSAAIMYATADALIRFAFSDSGFIPWIAAGMGIHFPLSKSSTNALDVSGISSATVFFGTLGFTMKMGDTSYLLGMAEYGLFPPSNSVSTSMITARFGYGWRW